MDNRIFIFSTFFVAVLFSGCAAFMDTTFAANSNPQVVIGGGGSFRNVDGIDVWESGAPSRPFCVIGFINQSRKDDGQLISTFARLSAESDILDEARKNGGDAIIFVTENTQFLGYAASGFSSSQVTASATPYYAQAYGASYANVNVSPVTQTAKRVAVIRYVAETRAAPRSEVSSNGAAVGANSLVSNVASGQMSPTGSLAGYWTGSLSGTNSGNLVLELQQSGDALSGTAKIHESALGLSEYYALGSIKGKYVIFTFTPMSASPNLVLGKVSAVFIAQDNATLSGKWKSSIGTEGVAVLKKS